MTKKTYSDNNNTLNKINQSSIKLNYCIMITSLPYGNEHSHTALQFIYNLISYGHNINCIFFYKNGVYHANSFLHTDDDEINILKSWTDLHIKYNIPLYVCITAALRRGIIDNKNKTQFLQHKTLCPQNGFLLIGLSKFIKKMLQCDKFIQF